MSKRADEAFLSDIQEAIRRVEMYVEGVAYPAFLQDTKTQDAVIHNLEIIGEAAKQISAELRAAHPDIPWKYMAGTRDRLIHHYFGTNLDIVWQIVTDELPKVARQISEILEGGREQVDK